MSATPTEMLTTYRSRSLNYNHRLVASFGWEVTFTQSIRMHFSTLPVATVWTTWLCLFRLCKILGMRPILTFSIPALQMQANIDH
eukprot:scaffold22693_cov34-Prasinocladus_malaysianus.AAC.1